MPADGKVVLEVRESEADGGPLRGSTTALTKL